MSFPVITRTDLLSLLVSGPNQETTAQVVGFLFGQYLLNITYANTDKNLWSKLMIENSDWTALSLWGAKYSLSRDKSSFQFLFYTQD